MALIDDVLSEDEGTQATDDSEGRGGGGGSSGMSSGITGGPQLLDYLIQSQGVGGDQQVARPVQVMKGGASDQLRGQTLGKNINFMPIYTLRDLGRIAAQTRGLPEEVRNALIYRALGMNYQLPQQGRQLSTEQIARERNQIAAQRTQEMIRQHNFNTFKGYGNMMSQIDNTIRNKEKMLSDPKIGAAISLGQVDPGALKNAQKEIDNLRKTRDWYRQAQEAMAKNLGIQLPSEGASQGGPGVEAEVSRAFGPAMMGGSAGSKVLGMKPTGLSSLNQPAPQQSEDSTIGDYLGQY